MSDKLPRTYLDLTKYSRMAREDEDRRGVTGHETDAIRQQREQREQLTELHATPNDRAPRAAEHEAHVNHLDDAIRAYQREHRCSYAEAFEAVKDDRPDVAIAAACNPIDARNAKIQQLR